MNVLIVNVQHELTAQHRLPCDLHHAGEYLKQSEQTRQAQEKDNLHADITDVNEAIAKLRITEQKLKAHLASADSS
jgi:hypothetical protein